MGRGRLLLAVGIVVALVAGGLGAVLVTGSDRDERPPTAGRPVKAPEGSLRVGVPELPATYDPFDVRGRTPAGAQILSMVLPQLFDVAPDGRVRGRLVEPGSVEVRGLTARMRLAQGAVWSDGRPITAADVRFTLDVVRSDAWPGPAAGYDRIEAVRGRGNDLVLEFSERVSGWERLFSGSDFVLPRHRLEGEDLDTVWRTGPDVSGGPYELAGSTPGLDVVLRDNDRWWGEGPGIADLRVLAVPDPTTLRQLWERGELDLVWVLEATERLLDLADLEGADVAVGEPGGRLVSLFVNAEEIEEPVRVAALDLVDRTRFVEVLLQGEVVPALSWGGLTEDPGWPNWLVSTAKAKELDDPVSLELVAAEEQPMAGILTRAVQRRSRGTRLSFDAVRVGAEMLDGEWLPEGRFDLVLVDEMQWPKPCWRCRFDDEFTGVTNWPRVEGLADVAAAADRGERESASRLERTLQEGGLLLPLWRPVVSVVSRGVEGVEANAWAPGPFSRPERWVRTESES